MGNEGLRGAVRCVREVVKKPGLVVGLEKILGL